ncbi:MAG: hypothetical protein HC888_03990 [Candidatus Competibacteraceae bacterium]|nr:hypothetical protein [Candidatus Competibacteraceae bacterium]
MFSENPREVQKLAMLFLIEHQIRYSYDILLSLREASAGMPISTFYILLEELKNEGYIAIERSGSYMQEKDKNNSIVTITANGKTHLKYLRGELTRAIFGQRAEN